jgi:hypothetical protein
MAKKVKAPEAVPTSYIKCSIKLLPEEHRISAAETAVKHNPANAPSMQMYKMAFPDDIMPPAKIAVLTTKYWGQGGVSLTVGFLDNPPTALRKRILSHMNAWGKFANVKFVESNTSPQVRIARQAGDGYWSYLGTDILHIAPGEPTMNLDSFSLQTPISEFFRVVRHETGHTLGFPHEHMRAEIVNGIDREKAISFFMRTQGWSRQDVINQVLTPINNSALMGTQQADEHSIMCYALPAEIMKKGMPVPGGVDIDALDKAFVKTIYPKPKTK